MKDFNLYPTRIEFSTTAVESGNPYRQLGGKFGTGPTGVKKANPTPAGAVDTPDQDEIDRKYDQIRAAARTLTTYGIEPVKAFLQSASNRELTEQEVNDLYQLVRQQIVSDLVYYFYQQKQQADGDSIKIDATDSAVTSRLNSLTPQEKQNFAHRMEALGWKQEELNGILE